MSLYVCVSISVTVCARLLTPPVSLSLHREAGRSGEGGSAVLVLSGLCSDFLVDWRRDTQTDRQTDRHIRETVESID